MKKLMVILIVLVSAMWGWGQRGRDFFQGNRNTSYIEISDYAGFQSECADDLNDVAGELKSILNSSDTDVKIIIHKVYPPSVYIKNTDGANAMAQVALNDIKSNNRNYILFLAYYIENELADIDYQMELPDANLATQCRNSMEIHKSQITKNLKADFVNNSFPFGHVECYAKNALQYLKKTINNGCGVDYENRRSFLELQGFERYELGPLELVTTDSVRSNRLITSARNTCAYADYTQGQLKYRMTESGSRRISDLVTDVTSTFQKRIIITDGFISSGLLASIDETEMVNPSCEVVIWLHFENGFESNGDEVFIKVARQNKPPASSECYSYEQLRDMYKSGSQFNSPLPKIDFRLKNYREQLLDFFNSYKNSEIIPLDVVLEAEFYTGFVAGFIDGVIETADLALLIGGSIRKFNGNYNPLSEAWWSDLYFYMNEKRNLYEAFREKWDETYENWIDLYDGIQDAYDDIVNDRSVIGNAFVIFYETIIKLLDKYIDDILFKNEDFDAGYAIGKTAFDFIPFAAFAKVGKGLTAVFKSGRSGVYDISKNISENISDDVARKVLKEATIDLSELLAKLGNRAHLKAWFNNGMPAWVKMRLASMSDEALDYMDDALKRFPNLKTEWINTPKMFTFAENLQKDWWAKYGLGGLSKRTNGGITSEMKKLIGETEVVTNGIKTKLKQFTIGDEAAGTIGRAFDDEIIGRLKNSFGSGDFSNFPPSVRTSFQDAYNQGYKLVTNEPRLSINGQNFDPDILFVKTNVVQGITVTDIKYIDVKYLDDVPFNSGGQSAIKAAVSANGSTTVVNTTNANLFDEIAQAAIPNTSGNLTITSVEKLSIKVSDLGIIIQ